MGESEIQPIRRKRDIFGFACNPPRECPECHRPSDIFEKMEKDGKVIFICPECVDKAIEELKKQIEEYEAEHFGEDPDYY